MPAKTPYQSRILLYNERPAACGSLLPALQASFHSNAVTIETTDLSALRENLRQKHLAFVLPGIIGTDSLYTDQLTPDIVKTIHNKIENGMVGIFICAGAAFLSRETQYNPPWGKPKHRKQLQPLFNGLAKGPIEHLARAPSESIDRRIALAPVAYELPDGTPRTASIYYGNGAYFLPDDDNDPNIKIVARLDTVESTPPAILRVQKGKGFCYFMTVHPEIGPVALNSDTTIQDPASVDKLTQALQQHETGRQELWGMIMQDILDHRSHMTGAANRNKPAL